MPLRVPTMRDHQLLTLHWRPFSGWGRECLSTCFLYKGCQYIRKWLCSTILDILQWTVGYLNATINRKSRNAEPVIGTGGSGQAWQHPRVDGYGSGFGPPRGSRSGVWLVLEPNQPVFPIWTLTARRLHWPVPNTKHEVLLIYEYNIIKILKQRTELSLPVQVHIDQSIPVWLEHQAIDFVLYRMHCREFPNAP